MARFGDDCHVHVGPAEDIKTGDCRHCAHLEIIEETTWCTNQEAQRRRSTSVPVIHDCPDWHAAAREAYASLNVYREQPMERYSYSILGLCSTIHEAYTESGGDIPTKTIAVAAVTLADRLRTWKRHQPSCAAYDVAVSNLMLAALREAIAVAKRRESIVVLPDTGPMGESTGPTITPAAPPAPSNVVQPPSDIGILDDQYHGRFVALTETGSIVSSGENRQQVLDAARALEITADGLVYVPYPASDPLKYPHRAATLAQRLYAQINTKDDPGLAVEAMAFLLSMVATVHANITDAELLNVVLRYAETCRARYAISKATVSFAAG